MRRAATRLSCPLVLCLLTANAQTTKSARADNPDKGAWIHGTVISDATSQPLQRAQVVLRPAAGTAPAIGAETDENGRFIINRISPGSYTVMAQRDGYLPNAAARRGAIRIPPVILLNEGTHMRDLTFRMKPWGVIAGRVKFDDGEPASGASVQLYKETTFRGRHSMQIVASARVDDRGDFRVAGLAPGGYYVSATRTRPVSRDLEEQETIDDEGRPLTQYRYATTFFPSAQKLGDATLVHVESGQEIGGIDVFLKPVPSVNIRMRTINGITGFAIQNATIVFRRLAADGLASISVPVDMRRYRDGFEIRGITAGPYLITADANHDGKRIFDRALLTVTDAAIDNFEMVLSAEKEMPGVIRLDDSAQVDLSKLRVSLEPRSDLNPSAGSGVRQAQFQTKVVPGETYDAYVENMPPDLYIKTVRLGNIDIGPDGISGLAAAPNVPLEITLSARSGKLLGRAFTADGRTASGATILIVPDPIQGRTAAYQAVSADDYGVFRMTGIPPGNYTAFAYYDEAPCDVFDEIALARCRSLGRDVSLAESAQSTIELRIP